ncbi:MAG: hypothetical protein ACFFEF_06700 [Candidatus Thorarchaeota archaeon]
MVNYGTKPGRRVLVAVLMIGIVVGLLLYTPITIWLRQLEPHGSGFFAASEDYDFEIELNVTHSNTSINTFDVFVYQSHGWFDSPVFAIEVSNLRTNGSPINMYFLQDNITIHKLENITDYSNCTVRIGPSPIWADVQLSHRWIEPSDIAGQEYQIRIERLNSDSIVNFTLVIWIVGFWIE